MDFVSISRTRTLCLALRIRLPPRRWEHLAAGITLVEVHSATAIPYGCWQGERWSHEVAERQLRLCAAAQPLIGGSPASAL
jgi:hypothetical protein